MLKGWFLAPRRNIHMQTFSSSVWNSSQAATVEPKLVAGRAQRRPHVLFLIDHLMWRGGGEGNLLKVVELLPPELVRCSVATLRIDPEIQKNVPVPVHVFGWRRVYHLDALQAAWRLRELIREEKVDIVQTYFETSNLWGGLIAKLSGASLLSCRRDLGILRSTKHHLAYRLINRISDRVLAVSEDVRRFCVDQDRVDPRKIVVLYNGVDLRQIASSAASPGQEARAATDDEQIITCVANIRRVKGIDVLIQTAQRVCRELPRTVFVIAGSMNEREYGEQIQALILSLGMKHHVKLLGFVENPVPLLKASSAFCLLSRSEGFCNALLEAMACGVPPVVSRVGGNPEAVEDGESGFLVPVEDPDAAASRLLLLLRDPARAVRMGQAARAAVCSRFSADTMIQNFINLYNELMAERERTA
jgi:glycosyltransferase involved in cell wall biosynthesis